MFQRFSLHVRAHDGLHVNALVPFSLGFKVAVGVQ